ncbi:hypothetical protein F5I97DRAFT_1826706 [Phlebopus sp. FC_14]|nr:hypothetical protein F5I97DRAFT_1826706 [Phlebopus sp. FC_14]
MQKYRRDVLVDVQQSTANVSINLAFLINMHANIKKSKTILPFALSLTEVRITLTDALADQHFEIAGEILTADVCQRYILASHGSCLDCLSANTHVPTLHSCIPMDDASAVANVLQPVGTGITEQCIPYLQLSLRTPHVSVGVERSRYGCLLSFRHREASTRIEAQARHAGDEIKRVRESLRRVFDDVNKGFENVGSVLKTLADSMFPLALLRWRPDDFDTDQVTAKVLRCWTPLIAF